jgi:hypothetical protein
MIASWLLQEGEQLLWEHPRATSGAEANPLDTWRAGYTAPAHRQRPRRRNAGTRPRARHTTAVRRSSPTGGHAVVARGDWGVWRGAREGWSANQARTHPAFQTRRRWTQSPSALGPSAASAAPVARSSCRSWKGRGQGTRGARAATMGAEGDRAQWKRKRRHAPPSAQ